MLPMDVLTLGGSRIRKSNSSLMCFFPRALQGFAEVLGMEDKQRFVDVVLYGLGTDLDNCYPFAVCRAIMQVRLV
jgi:hypothetical protein